MTADSMAMHSGLGFGGLGHGHLFTMATNHTVNGWRLCTSLYHVAQFHQFLIVQFQHISTGLQLSDAAMDQNPDTLIFTAKSSW